MRSGGERRQDVLAWSVLLAGIVAVGGALLTSRHGDEAGEAPKAVEVEQWTDPGTSLAVGENVTAALETGAREALGLMWAEREIPLTVETVSCRTIESGAEIVSFLHETRGREHGYRALCTYTVAEFDRELHLTIDAVVHPGRDRHDAGVATEVDHVMSTAWVEWFAAQNQMSGEVRCEGGRTWFVIAPGERHRCTVGEGAVVMGVEMEPDTPRARFSITRSD